MAIVYHMNNGRSVNVVADVYPEEISASVSKSCEKIEIDWTDVDPAVIHMMIGDNITVMRAANKNYLIPLEKRTELVQRAEMFGQRVKFTRVVDE